MADSTLGDSPRRAALRNINELIAQRARHPPRRGTILKQEAEAVRRDSPIDLAATVSNEDQKQKYTCKQVRDIGRNIIADTYAQETVRNGEIAIFNPQPNAEYFSHNIQRNGLRDGTAPAGDWIAYGATLWIGMDQFENIAGAPVHLAGFRGIFTS